MHIKEIKHIETFYRKGFLYSFILSNGFKFTDFYGYDFFIRVNYPSHLIIENAERDINLYCNKLWC